MTTIVQRAGVLLAAVLLTAGCAGGDGGGALGGRPSADRIASSIEDGTSGLGVPPSQADCAAEIVVGSDMSDKVVAGYLPPDDPGYVADPEFTDVDRAAFQQVLADLEAECGFQQAAG